MKKIIGIILLSIIGISIIPKTLINEKHIVLESTTSAYTKEEVDSLLSTIRTNITTNTNDITNIKSELTSLKNSLTNYALKTSLNTTNSNIDNLNTIATNNTSRIEALENNVNTVNPVNIAYIGSGYNYMASMDGGDLFRMDVTNFNTLTIGSTYFSQSNNMALQVIGTKDSVNNTIVTFGTTITTSSTYDISGYDSISVTLITGSSSSETCALQDVMFS